MATDPKTATPETPATDEADPAVMTPEQAEADESAAFNEFAQLADGDAAESEASEPEPEPEGDTTPPPPEEPETPQGESDDPLAGLTDAQRKAFEELQRGKARAEHAFESNRNRLSAYHRKLNATEAELEQLRNQQQAASTPNPATPPATSQPTPQGQARTDGGENVDLDKFKEDFPEVYAAMVSMRGTDNGDQTAALQAEVNALKERLGEVSQPIQQMDEERRERYQQTQREALAAAHPDWSEIEKDDAFWGWLGQQSETFQNLARSTVAEDNIVLLDSYKRAAGISAPSPTPEPSRTATKPSTPPRPRQPAASAQLPRAGTSKPGSPLDAGSEEDMWEHWAKEANANRI